MANSSTSAEKCRDVLDSLREAFDCEIQNYKSSELEPHAAISLAKRENLWPCVLAEPADNIGGGAPGDATWLLRELLDHQVSGFAIALCDARAVEKIFPQKIGSNITCTVGGWSGPLSGGPITIHATLRAKSEGRFEVEDKHSHFVIAQGNIINMGNSVLLEDDRENLILLNSRKTMPADLGQWRSLGAQPERLKFLVAKAAIAHRRAYDPIAKISLSVCTPGVCTSRISSLPYKYAQGVIFDGFGQATPQFDASSPKSPSALAMI